VLQVTVDLAASISRRAAKERRLRFWSRLLAFRRSRLTLSRYYSSGKLLDAIIIIALISSSSPRYNDFWML
jgi:hypothetical protein